MLLGRVFGALRLQREECLDQARPRVARIDDVVEVAARRRLIGMGELFAVLVGALFARFSFIENLDRSLGTHDGDLRRGPGHVVVAADVLGAHDVVRAAIRLARDDGELRNRGFTVGEQQLRAVLDDAAMFLGHAGKKPGHVLEGHERNVEGVAEADEPGALERGGDVEHAGEGGGLIGDHADRPAGEPREPDDQVVAVVPLDLEKRRVVDDVAEDVVHVVRLRRLIRDDLEERLFAAVGRIVGRAGRGTVQIVAREERQQRANRADRLELGIVHEMRYAGGAAMHVGIAHFVHDSELESIGAIRTLLSFLPGNNLDSPPTRTPDDPPDRREEALLEVVPDEPAKPYDMHDILRQVVDNAAFLEVQRDYGNNLIVGFARLAGRPVGIIANQPAALAGVLDIAASLKGARFIRFCDAFNIPLVTFEDVPGFLPGVAQEHGGIIKHGAKLLFAFCEATVPKLTVITRKAYGGAYDVMSSKHIRGDLNLAWPSAEIAVMGPKGAVEILFKDEIAQAADPAAATARLIDEYTAKFAHPYAAAARGYIDDVIDPRDTRPRLIDALRTLRSKRERNHPRKHGNIPL